MLKRIRRHLDGNTERGFTLIELLVVMIIIGILLAIAVPSYLGFRDRAATNAAQSNLRAALPSAEAYFADNGTYVGMDTTDLVALDSGISRTLTVASVTTNTYCLTDTVSSHTWSVAGPDSSSADYKNNATCA